MKELELELQPKMLQMELKLQPAGPAGRDGTSSFIHAEQTADGAVIYTRDGEGESTAVLRNGRDGTSSFIHAEQTADGAVIYTRDGEGESTAVLRNGRDGTSSFIHAEQTADGAVIHTRDGEGESTAVLRNGRDGETGSRGPIGPAGEQGAPGRDGVTPVKGVDYFDGKDGQDGADGFSPLVDVIPKAGGASIVVTDRSGTKETELQFSSGTVPTRVSQLENDAGYTTEAALAVEHQRISSLATLTSGSTTGDAELLDARTDRSGVTHTNVGDHIRYEAEAVKMLKNGIETLADYGIFERGYIGSSNGQNIDQRDYRIRSQGYLQFERDVTLRVAPGYRIAVFYYDENNGYLGDHVSSASWTVLRNQKFRIAITKATEDYAAADVGHFLKQVTMQSVFHEHLNRELYGDYVIPLPETWFPGYAFIENNQLTYGGVTGSYRNTGFVEVQPFRTVRLQNIYAVAYTAAIIFDSNYQIIHKEAYETTSVKIPEYTLQIPANGRYLMFSTTSTTIPTCTAAYLDYVPRWYLPEKLIGQWNDAAHGKLQTPFAKILAKGPIITLIDDDTLDEAQIRLFHDLCVQNQICGTFSVETTHVLEENTAALLLQYEQEGFHMAYHCRDQQLYYRPEPENRDEAQMLANFVEGLQQMKTIGLTDYNFFVSPYGVADAAVQTMAKKWGMECLVSISQKEFEDTSAAHGRFNISRVGFNQTDSGSSTFDELKSLMDAAAQKSGWLLVGTHMYTWDPAVGYDRFHEMVAYAKQKGFQFMTLNEAFRIRQPIYQLYESF